MLELIEVKGAVDSVEGNQTFLGDSAVHDLHAEQMEGDIEFGNRTEGAERGSCG